MGLLYDSDALSAASALVADWTTEERAFLRATVPRLGLATPFRGKTLNSVAAQAVAISKVRVAGKVPRAARCIAVAPATDALALPSCIPCLAQRGLQSRSCKEEGYLAFLEARQQPVTTPLPFHQRPVCQHVKYSGQSRDALSPIERGRPVVQAIVEDGMSIADRRLKEYETSWNKSVDSLFLQHTL